MGAMIKFLFGVAVGIVIFFLFLYFGGGGTVKKIGEGITETGKRMESLEGGLKKEKSETLKDVKKKVFKDEKGFIKESQ